MMKAVISPMIPSTGGIRLMFMGSAWLFSLTAVVVVRFGDPIGDRRVDRLDGVPIPETMAIPAHAAANAAFTRKAEHSSLYHAAGQSNRPFAHAQSGRCNRGVARGAAARCQRRAGPAHADDRRRTRASLEPDLSM